MGHDVLVAGETLIDFVPDRPGPLESVAGFERRPGGAPANVAVALARLDRPPLFWTRLGDDPFGRYLEAVLARRGLPDRLVERDPEAKTTLAFVVHDEDGDRSTAFYRDGTADTRMEPGTVPDDVLREVAWVHAGGVALSSGRSREATLELLDRAAARGCTVSFDPNYRQELRPDESAFRNAVGEALDRVDVLKATRSELRALGVEADDDRALVGAARSLGPETVYLTRGNEGAIAASARDEFARGDRSETVVAEHAGFEVDAVDATGAGDAFVAGAIASTLDGRDLESTLAFANAVAAAATTGAGAMAALPDRGRVRTILGSDT